MLVENQNEQEQINQSGAPDLVESGQTQQAETVTASEEFELVYNGGTDTPEISQNAVQAAKRIARKREMQMQETIEKLNKGEISDELKVAAELPARPDMQNYLSEDALERYDYDTNKALAQFTSDQNQWLIDVQEAQNNASAQQQKKVSDYINQSSQIQGYLKQHYDNAEKYGINDIDEIEERMKETLDKGLFSDIVVLFPEKSAAILKHLDLNPQKREALINQHPAKVIRDLTTLAANLTFKTKTLSSAPVADTPLGTGDTGSDKSSIMEQMKKAADKGDVKEYRRLKSLL